MMGSCSFDSLACRCLYSGIARGSERATLLYIMCIRSRSVILDIGGQGKLATSVDYRVASN